MSYAKRLKSNKGFTLIEIVTVMVVLGILSFFTFRFIDFAVKTYMIGSKQRMLYQEASYIMERITREARDAKELHILNSGTDGSALYISKAHGPGEAPLMDPNQYVVYSRDETVTPPQLLRGSSAVFAFAPPTQVIGSRVKQFKIEYENCSAGPSFVRCFSEGDVVQITLSLYDPNIPIEEIGTTADELARTVTLTTKISPKNYIPSVNPYAGRSFNGGYYDVVQ